LNVEEFPMNGVQDQSPTWKEWIAMAVCVPPLFVAAMIALGTMIDDIVQYQEQHDRCLRHASNGYEIRQCH